MFNTIDDASYYARTGTAKKDMIYDFVMSKNDIHSIYDVGCNNGDLSYPFIAEGIDVLGMDASEKLSIKEPYKFIQKDATTMNDVHLNDCTLFLSLYHHLFGNIGIERADDLFYQLLLRTKYLIFDTGTPEEDINTRGHWVRPLREHFSTQKELLDHFGLSYTKITEWQTGTGIRDVVVFKNSDFDSKAVLVEEYRRKIGAEVQYQGLFTISEISRKKIENIWNGTHFYKLYLGNKMFFAKKWANYADWDKSKDWARAEKNKIIEAYEKLLPENLITFYGFSKQYGFIYEWLDNPQYIGKIRTRDIDLADPDILLVGGQLKITDFGTPPEWDT